LQEKQTVHLRTNAFDVWAYRKDKDAVRYLLLPDMAVRTVRSQGLMMTVVQT
jgi:hypothetical protein